MPNTVTTRPPSAPPSAPLADQPPAWPLPWRGVLYAERRARGVPLRTDRGCGENVERCDAGVATPLRSDDGSSGADGAGLLNSSSSDLLGIANCVAAAAEKEDVYLGEAIMIENHDSLGLPGLGATLAESEEDAQESLENMVLYLRQNTKIERSADDLIGRLRELRDAYGATGGQFLFDDSKSVAELVQAEAEALSASIAVAGFVRWGIDDLTTVS